MSDEIDINTLAEQLSNARARNLSVVTILTDQFEQLIAVARERAVRREAVTGLIETIRSARTVYSFYAGSDVGRGAAADFDAALDELAAMARGDGGGR